MFEDLQRELRKLSQQPLTLNLSLPEDEDGYIDRECPGEQCEGAFKVSSTDLQRLWTSSVAFCAFCRNEAPPQKSWFTKAQAAYVEQLALQQLDRRLSSAMVRDAARQNARERSRPKNKFIDIGITMQVKCAPGQVLIPPNASKILEQRFACEQCGFRWASLGASFFCHACGHNCVLTTFDMTMATVRETIAALPAICDLLSTSLGADTAENTARQLREDQFSRIVGAFECLSQALFNSLPNTDLHAHPGNVFQRVEDSSTLWCAATGSGFDSFLSPRQLVALKVGFQKRHVLGHNQGIVDQRNIDKSGDKTYQVGQRLVVKNEDVLDFVDLVETLTAGLRTLRPKKNESSGDSRH